MKRLAELRILHNVTQADIARGTGISKEAYLQYENGTAPPDLKAVSVLADYFGVSIDYLLERTDNPAGTDSLYHNPQVSIPEVLKNAGLDFENGNSLTQKDVDEIAGYAESLKNRKKKK